MKMKNMLIGGMSLALVACITIGGTLAYLTDETETVTNTFIASAGIAMTLDEADVKLNDDGTAYVKDDLGGRVNENEYENILPEEKQYKDPTVHVTSVPESGAEVYIRISGLEDVEDKYTVETYFDAENEINPMWQPVPGYSNLYKYTNSATDDLMTQEIIEAGQGDVVVFEGITYNWDNETAADEDFEFAPVTVKAYAIQAGVEDAALRAATALLVDPLA